MVSTVNHRNFFNTACATVALAIAGPFALVGVYAAVSERPYFSGTRREVGSA